MDSPHFTVCSSVLAIFLHISMRFQSALDISFRYYQMGKMMIDLEFFGYPIFGVKPWGIAAGQRCEEWWNLIHFFTLLYFAMFGLGAIYWRNMKNIHRELGPCFPALCLQSASFGFGLIFPRCRTTSKQFVPLPAAANTRTTQSLRAASCFPLCQAGRCTASVSNRLEDFSGAFQDRMNVKQCETGR